MNEAPRVTLVGRPGCHLCDEARQVVARVSDELGVGWQELSIDDEPALAQRWAEEIPVVLVDGRQHSYFTVEESRLRSALRRPATAGRSRWSRRT